jgi:hypothetical protein
MSEQGWTEMEFIAALRGAGWRRVRGPARIYESPDHVLFHLDEYQAGTGVAWRWYAGRRELPEKFQPWPVRMRGRLREAMGEEGGSGSE